jgi:hypothetical protein
MHQNALRLPLPLFALSLLVLVACGGAQIAPVPDAVITPVPPSDPGGRTTVMVLGTLHEGHLRGGYPLEVVEGVVRAFRPDVVLVELQPSEVGPALAAVDALEDPLDAASGSAPLSGMPELYAVVLPLRHELGYEVVGVSATDAGAIADREAYYRDAPHGPVERRYLVANATLHAATIGNEGPRDPVWLHSEEFAELVREATLWLAYFAEEAMGRGGELRLQARSAALVDAALDAASGDRVLIVYDVAARWWLEDALDVRTDVRREDVRTLLPGRPVP